MHKLPTVLEGIVRGRRSHLDEIHARIAHVDIESLPRSQRSLYDSLNQGRGGARFIMECKSASPSLGMIRENYHPGDVARIYSRFASGISVLCEPDHFNGDYDHLSTVAASTHLPVLCKDFIVDEVQIHAARYFGADAILLMLSVLDDAHYATLAAEAERFGLDVLTEVIDEEEVERAISLGAQIFGINHRNLHNLSIDLGRSGRLSALIPPEAVLISESGIRNNDTVRRLGSHSHGFLVGSQLTSQADVDMAARELIYGENKVCGLSSETAAQVARAAGAVYGGLIFEETSPRNVSRETSKKIIAAEPDLRYVAVSRRTSGFADLVQDGIYAVQIHAPLQDSVEEELALVTAVRAELPEGIQIWRALSMNMPLGPTVAEALLDSVDRLVLDTHSGGSGETFDWSTIPDSVKSVSLLAGGISPANVTAALEVGCLGLDINSGIEYPSSAREWAGKKDAGATISIFSTIRTFHY